MAYTVVNLITLVVGLIFLGHGYYLARRGREDIAIFVMSAVVGIGLIVVSVFPDIFDIIAAILGLELKARAILVISNLTLFVLVTYLFNRIGKLNEQISSLNEELSLHRVDESDWSDDQ